MSTLKELILMNHGNKYNDTKIDSVLSYRDLLIEENKTQNITRIINDEDFYYNNFLDCHNLIESGFIEKGIPAIDLGSGGGVPGLLCALLSDKEIWVLSESEKKKTEFLKRAISELGVSNRVSATSERAETFLGKKGCKGHQIISRAVGSISKIEYLLFKCSTWNTITLFKGPGWDKEWTEYLGKFKKPRVTLLGKHDYPAGEKKRVLVTLKKVPRGT